MNRKFPEDHSEDPRDDTTHPSVGGPTVPRRTWKRPPPAPKRRGRPKKAKLTTSFITTLFKNKAGRPKQHKVDDRWIVDLVDGHKSDALLTGRGDMSDARALAELLYRGAPPQIRRDLDEQLAFHNDSAETKYAEKHALHRAVMHVEGPRFEWWIKRLSRARSNLRKPGR